MIKETFDRFFALTQDKDGEIVEFNHLGGLLSSYRRVKQAA